VGNGVFSEHGANNKPVDNGRQCAYICQQVDTETAMTYADLIHRLASEGPWTLTPDNVRGGLTDADVKAWLEHAAARTSWQQVFGDIIDRMTAEDCREFLNAYLRVSPLAEAMRCAASADATYDADTLRERQEREAFRSGDMAAYKREVQS